MPIALRNALRSLRRSPGFVATSVVALGLGLSLVTTMAAILDAVTRPYVPYREPEQLYRVSWWFGRRASLVNETELFRVLRDEVRSFQGVVLVAGGSMEVEAGPDSRQVSVDFVPPEYFELLGVRPQMGRNFDARDASDDVAILSHGLWRQIFGKRRSVEGATVAAGSRVFTVIGVMPRGTGGQFGVAAWLPLPPSAQPSSAWRERPTVRLRHGVTKEQADQELAVIARRLTDIHRAYDAPFGFTL